MSISACLIVKNEAKNIQACIESINFFDEIIIVDTGSTDNTKELAGKYPNVKLYDFEWCNDFAKARNYSLSKATGNWILWIDADERLSTKSVDYVMSLDKPVNPTGLQCVIRSKSEVGHWTEASNLRIFSRFEGLKFQSKVHEQIVQSIIDNDGKLYNCPVIIEHYGYVSAEVNRQKQLRNKELMEQMLSENPGDISTIKLLARNYALMKNYIKARSLYKHVINSGQEGMYAVDVYNSYAECQIELSNYKDAIRWLERSAKINKGQETVWYLYYRVFRQKRDWHSGLKAIQNLRIVNEFKAKGGMTKTLTDIHLNKQSIDEYQKECESKGYVNRNENTAVKMANGAVYRFNGNTMYRAKELESAS